MTIGIVGLGLIGGSIGLALRDPSRTVLGYDVSESNAKVALSRFCVDRLATLAAVSQSDLVFVAVPPAHVVSMLDQIAEVRGQDTVVTDCASVKADVTVWADKEGSTWFVGGHPMAGHEKNGAAFSSAWMFRNASWILTPTKSTDPKALKLVEETIRHIGGDPVRIPPDAHDRQVAVLSHLPHALAAALVMVGVGSSNPQLGGGSWKDLTRVGGVDPSLWTQIFMGNRQPLAKALEETQEILAKFHQSLLDGDERSLRDLFEQAKGAKEKSQT
jgi:prephenate dehydrogenase